MYVSLCVFICVLIIIISFRKLVELVYLTCLNLEVARMRTIITFRKIWRIMNCRLSGLLSSVKCKLSGPFGPQGTRLLFEVVFWLKYNQRMLLRKVLLVKEFWILSVFNFSYCFWTLVCTVCQSSTWRSCK